jgi:hypothetical protein
MASKIFIGIDPGETGSICAVNGKGGIFIHKMPENLLDKATCIKSLVASADEAFIILETVHASPQMGVVSAYTFGKGVGHLEAICMQLPKAEFEKVMPQKWQAVLNCMTGGDKRISRDRARELFPDEARINLKTADGLLIAYYGYMKHGR